MSSKYLLMAVVVVCLSAWFRLNPQPLTLNTLRLIQRQFTATPTINFYKLSLQWPPAACNSGQMNCTPPMPSEFSIHGIWPQDANDVAIPRYDPSNPRTNQTPTPSTDLTNILLPIETNLTSLWPNLVDPRNRSINYIFWEKQWNKHGTCSDYPTEPLLYFSSALLLRDGLTDLVMGLHTGTSYTVQDVVTEVHTHVKAYPEIACNINKNTGARQLWEIRLCYDRPTSPRLSLTIRDCPHRLPHRKGCIVGPCQQMTDIITFPG